MQGPAESAAKKLAWEMESWKSVELRVRDDFVNKDPARKPTSPQTFWSTSHYIETAVGQRLLDMRMKPDNVDHTRVSIDYTNGSKCAALLRTDKEGVTGQEQVTINRAFSYEDDLVTNRPGLLRYLYVGLRPLHEVLPQAKYLGVGRRLGRECDRFLFTSVKGKGDPAHLVYWLDRATGITLRHEHYENDQARAEGRPYFVWNAKSLDDVSGHYLALESELLQFDSKGPDPQLVMLEYQHTTQEVAFDRDYPASMFWPSITKDTKVFDMIANKIVFPKTKATTSTAEPIRAVDPTGWGLSYSTVGMLVGGAALVAGIALRQRQG